MKNKAKHKFHTLELKHKKSKTIKKNWKELQRHSKELNFHNIKINMPLLIKDCKIFNISTIITAIITSIHTKKQLWEELMGKRIKSQEKINSDICY